jgi:hypothetical protein
MSKKGSTLREGDVVTVMSLGAEAEEGWDTIWEGPGASERTWALYQIWSITCCIVRCIFYLPTLHLERITE